MALCTTQSIEKILEVLKNHDITTIVLHGKRGVGKTQMAREIRMKEELIYDSLWLYLNNKYDSESLCKNIACQLSLFFIHDEWEYDDTEENESLENLRPKISKKLEELISAANKQNKFFLLILDAVPHEQDVEAIMSELKKLLHPNEPSFQFLKVLITRDESDSRPVTDKGRKEEIQSYTWLYNMYIEQLSTKESKNLLRDNIKKEISDSPIFELLSEVIVEKGKSTPNEIIKIAKAAANNEETAIKLLLQPWYETLPGGVLIDCFWHIMQLFSKHAGMHYNELITHWAIEGFIGCTDHIEKSYEQGHRVLMELVDLGVLRKHEDNMVVMGGIGSGITDHHRRGFNGTASLGLANVFEDDKCWEGFGRLTHADGMIKSPCSPKSWGKALTLLMDGSCLSRQVPDNYFQPMQRLQILTIFNPRFRPLPSSLCSLKSLSILVLRCCDLVEKIDHIGELKNLTVLEISGATCLKEIPDNLFANMPRLRSLNLSGARITSLPNSLFDKRELRWLILRRCSQLKELPSLRFFDNLMVLDLSGATSFKKFLDKTFKQLTKLQSIDLSNSQISRLPSLQNLSNLTDLLLGGCARLRRLPSLNTLPQLQILDLSGTTRLNEIQEEPLDSLKVLDLSGTSLTKLPPMSKFTNLRQLLLKDCLQIKELQQLGSLIHLQVLDLSGTRLKIFPNEISELTDLKVCHLPDERSMHDLDVGKISQTPQEVNWDECGISEHADISVDSDKSPISVSGTEIFQFLDKNPKFWETKFKRFQFFVTTKKGEDGDVICCKDGLFFRDVYSRTRNFGILGNRDRSLEIHGSYSLPNGFESVLKHAEYISLVDNHLISRLSDLGADAMEVMKGCWIERCDKILSIFGGEKANFRLGSRLEILWISNLSKLRSLYNGKVEPECFKNLKHLYLDCCPMIVNVFPSSELPENLESVHVQFCDRLETLVDAPSKCTLKKLRTVYLLELPEMRSIGIELPDEVTFEAIECPKWLGNFGK